MMLRATSLALAAFLGMTGCACAAPQPPRSAESQTLIARATALFDASSILRRRDGKIVVRGAAGRAADEEADRNRRVARDLLRQASDRGDAVARQLYAQMVEAGVGGEANGALARQLYAESGTRIARWRLARMLEAGWGGPKDLTSARRLYRQASKEGQIDARYDYARMLRAGVGGAADAATARALLEGTAGFCHPEAADDLAAMAERGEGGPRDADLAAAQYLRAAGCATAFFRPPATLARWAEIDRDVRIAIQRRLAEKGYDGPTDGAWRPELKRLLVR